VQLQLLLLVLSAAATSFIVAAALHWCFRERTVARRAGLLGLAAGAIVGTRQAAGGWPDFPPIQAVDGWMPIVLAAATALVATARLGPIRSAIIAALAVGIFTLALPLAPLIARTEAATSRWAWRIGIVLAIVAMAAAVSHATARAAPAPRARFPDRHWRAVALALVLLISTPAILFAGFSGKLSMLMLALAGAFAGVVSAEGLAAARTRSSGHEVAAALAHALLWLMAYFTAQDFHPLALIAALVAPAMLIIGTTGLLVRRGGWLRLIVVALLAAGLLVSVAAVYGPAYLDATRGLHLFGASPPPSRAEPSPAVGGVATRAYLKGFH